jgi:hypothetical protein
MRKKAPFLLVFESDSISSRRMEFFPSIPGWQR